MDYLTRYYKNLCEDLQRKLNLLEYALPGVNPLTPKASPYGSSFRSTLRLPETLRASDKYDQLRPPDSLAISEIEPSQNWSPRIPQDETLEEPRWRSVAKRVDNYKQNLERIKSEEQEKERIYQERRQRFQPPPTPNLASLAGMSPTERSTAIAGMRSRDLEQIQKDRYNSAKINTMMGRAVPMGADNLEALGAISSELEDRRGPLGGSRNVEDAYRKLRQSVPERFIEVDLSQFNKVDDRIESKLKREREIERAIANAELSDATGKPVSYDSVLKRDELKALEDRVRKDMEKDFASSGKMSPQTYNTYAAISLAKDSEADKRAREHADLMASREEAAKKMYGDQWMRYM